MSPTALEQLVYSWAHQTLTGRGNGVVLMSTRWPTGKSVSNDDTLADLVAYVPAAELRQLSLTDRIPTSLESWYHPRLGHVIAARRGVGVDGSGRPGRTLVHLLLDAENALRPIDALNIADSGTLTEWDLDSEPTMSAAPLTVPNTTAAAPQPTESGIVEHALAGVLNAFDVGARAVLVVDEVQNRVAIVRAVLASLPGYLGQDRSFSTFRFDPSDRLFDITVLLHGRGSMRLAEDNRAHLIDLTRAAAPAVETALPIARALLLAYRAGIPVPPGLASFSQLDEWVRLGALGRREPSTLDLVEASAVLRAHSGAAWADRPAVLAHAAMLIASTDAVKSAGALIGEVSANDRPPLVRALYAGIGVAPGSMTERVTVALSADRTVALVGATPGPLRADSVRRLARVQSADADIAIGRLIASTTLAEWLEIADDPDCVDVILRHDARYVDAVISQTWTKQGWAAEHPVASAVAAHYIDRSIAQATRQLRVGSANIGLLDALLSAKGGERFAQVLTAAFKNPALSGVARRWNEHSGGADGGAELPSPSVTPTDEAPLPRTALERRTTIPTGERGIPKPAPARPVARWTGPVSHAASSEISIARPSPLSGPLAVSTDVTGNPSARPSSHFARPLVVNLRLIGLALFGASCTWLGLSTFNAAPALIAVVTSGVLAAALSLMSDERRPPDERPRRSLRKRPNRY